MAAIVKRAIGYVGSGAAVVSRVALTLAGTTLACLGLCSSMATAATTYVDGLSSEQVVNGWGFNQSDFAVTPGTFSDFFANSWINEGHIRLTREVAQWNAFAESSEGRYRSRFEDWYHDMTNSDYSGVGNLGLDLSLTNYIGTGASPDVELEFANMPKTTQEYKEVLKGIIVWAEGHGHAFSYVEPWNEPNAQGNMDGELKRRENEESPYTAKTAAEYTHAAMEVCKQHGCTVIAGNALDSGEKAEHWEKEYKEALGSNEPEVWGIHPYETVQNKSLARYEEDKKPFAGHPVIFTEVGPYYCGEQGKTIYGEREQTENAKWLVKTLMLEAHPLHVFDYDPLQVSEPCGQPQNSSTGLYQETSSPFVPDKYRPRGAAGWILENKAVSWPYTAPPTEVNVAKRSAYLQGVVYPGDKPAVGMFEYGLSSGYGSHTDERSEGEIGEAAEAANVEGLEPDTTYHFRLKAWNAETAETTPDYTFTTRPAPPMVAGDAPAAIGRTSATLSGQVYPEALPTEAWFEFNATGDSAQYTERYSEIWSDQVWHWVNLPATVEPCTKYESHLMASNTDTKPPKTGSEEPVTGPNEGFTTECWPPTATTAVASLPVGLQGRTGATLNGSVDPDGLATSYWFEYGKAGDSGEHKMPVEAANAGNGAESVALSEVIAGLTSCTEYEFRIVAENEDSQRPGSGDEGGVVRGTPGVFATQCDPPMARTTGSSGVAATAARLEGEVQPSGLATTYWFEYSADGGSSWDRTSMLEAGDGESFIDGDVVVGGLAKCTEYQFRIDARNEDAMNGPAKGPVYGDIGHFKTVCRPAVAGVTTSQLSPESAVLDAEVNPEGAATAWHFEYGTTRYEEGESGHGITVPSPGAAAGAGSALVKVSVGIVKLRPGQLYYLRLVAENESGTTTKSGAFSAPVVWTLGGTPVEAVISLTGRGEIGIGGVRCSVGVVATIGGLGRGEITENTPSSCVTEAPDAYCSTLDTPRLEARHLPWQTEVIGEAGGAVTEGGLWQPSLRISDGTGGVAEWALSCGGEDASTATCPAKATGIADDLAGQVAVEFEAVDPSCVLVASGGTERVGDEAVEGGLTLSDAKEALGVSGGVVGPLAPRVVTGGAVEEGGGVRLEGSVAARGVATSYWFEYGATVGYGARVPVEAGSVGDGRLPVSVAVAVGGLEGGVLYHYRLVAQNSGGTSYGADSTIVREYPPRWLSNGFEAGVAGVTVEGKVTVQDGGLGVDAECDLVGTGQIYDGNAYRMLTLTGVGGQQTIDCTAEQGGWCGTSAIEVTPERMPWHGELVGAAIEDENGAVHYEPRLRFNGPEDGLAWRVGCSFMGSQLIDQCIGTPSGKIENTSGSVDLIIDRRSWEMACSGSAIGTGTIEGALTLADTEQGRTLAVYGAPGA